ncbi:MAG: hypothetical protein ACO4CW_10750 [Planctomycetota bacterium]
MSAMKGEAGSRSEDPFASLLAVIVAGLLFIPALIWLGRGESAGELAPPAGMLEVLLRTVLVAGGGALGAWILGGCIGVLLAAYRAPFPLIRDPLLLSPFLLPSVVVTTAVQSWLAGGPLTPLIRGVPGAVLISTLQMAPLVMWIVTRSLRALPEEERLALRSSLSPAAVARQLGRRALPISARAAVLVFLLLVPRLEVPAYTGIETVGRRVLVAFTADGSDLEGWIWCVALLLLAAPLLPLAIRAIPSGRAPQAMGGTDPAAPRSLLATALVLLPAALPLVGLAGLAVDATGDGIAGGAEARRWSIALLRDLLRLAPLSILLSLIGWRIAVGIGDGVRARLLLALLAMPLVLPGCLPALIWIEGALPHLPRGLAETTLPLSTVQGLRFVAVAILLGRIADGSIPSAERAAARLLPPSVARRRIRLPRALPGVLAGAGLIFALLLGEVESAAQIAPPGRLLPAVELHQLLHYRYDVQAARLSLAIALVAGAWLLLRGARGERGGRRP